MSKTRRNHGSAFKAKVALEALKGEQTVAEIASKHGLHPTLVTEWKRQLAEGASSRKGPARPRRTARRRALQANRPAESGTGFFGPQARSLSRAERHPMIDRLNKHLSLTRQCQLLGLSRSSVYYQPAPDNTEDLALMALIQFLETPYYGSRKIGCAARAMSSIASGADASDGVAGDLAETQHQQAEPRAQGLSVLAARSHHRAPSLGDRYYVQPDAQGVLLPGGDHELAQQEGAGLAAVQYHGRDLLRRGAQGSPGHSRSTGDLQQRPGRPVYHSPACWRPQASGSAWMAKAAAWTMFSWNACGAA